MSTDESQGATAGLVLVNGRVRVLADGVRDDATAVAIADGRISAVGSDGDMRALASSGAEVIDLGGRAIMPAFVDSHTHFRRASLVMAYYLDFMELQPKSVSDVLDMVRRKVDLCNPGEWIQGDSLATLDIAERRFPDRYELDQVAPHNPVVLRGVGRHIIVANSLALSAAGIDANTPAPPGGRIERGANGEPNGRLHERAKLRLDTGHRDTVVPLPSERERVEALASGMAVLNSYGIACIHEMAREPFDLGDYQRLREQGGQSARVRFYIRGVESQTKLEYVVGLGLRSGFGDEWLRLGGVKFSIDGSEGLHNAALYEEYPGEPGNRGVIRIEADELQDLVMRSHEAGLQVAVHAIGPRAVGMALDAFERAQQVGSNHVLKHRIEHAHLPLRDGQLERMAKLGLIWSTQPGFLWDSADEWFEVFGDDAHRSLPLRKGIDQGMDIQLNTDYPCSRMNPFIGLATVVNRKTKRGTVVGAEEAITVGEALKRMCATPDENMVPTARHGRILPGYVADVIAVDRDPFVVPPFEIDTIGVDLTVVGGKVVHRKI